MKSINHPWYIPILLDQTDIFFGRHTLGVLALTNICSRYSFQSTMVSHLELCGLGFPLRMATCQIASTAHTRDPITLAFLVQSSEVVLKL